MSAARSINECARCEGALSAYADGELDPGHAMDLEVHLRQCGTCADRLMLLRAMRMSMKRTSAPRCPDALRARMGAVIAGIADERARCAARTVRETEPPPRLIPRRYAAALAAAAGVVFVVGVAQQRASTNSAGMTEVSSRADIPASSVESLLDDLVAQHAQPLPPETTDPEDLPRFDPLVGVPVRRPKSFQPFLVSFKGARVHAMRDRRAALLQYTVSGNHRVTVYLFDSHTLPVQKAPLLTQRLVRERPVYVGKINGYSVAAAEQSGVGYALATDLGDDESTQLVLAAMQ